MLKATALVWIVWNHVVERLFGFPLAGNPAADWPPLADRIAQLAPLTGQGWLDIPLESGALDRLGRRPGRAGSS